MTRAKQKTAFDTEKEYYFKLYKSWKKIYCPALEAHVYFTVWGWNHILHKKDRTERQRIQRMRLLPHARIALMEAQTYHKKRTVKEYIMYEIHGASQKVEVSVIVSTKGKKYYFLSVMKT